MSSCFIIQPFDNGTFDFRYEDVFKPAIEAAGLEPYRVDADPGANIPIDQIESGIRQALVCFADITLDNPNVWFELGYAFASNKEVCMVCSDERTSKFPFDVQHRRIERYKARSPRDFSDLSKKITQRLTAMKDQVEKFEVDEIPALLKGSGGLSQREILTLASMVEVQDEADELVTHSTLRRQMERHGQNNLAVHMGVNRLLGRGLIRDSFNEDEQGYRYSGYRVTPQGISWLIENEELLNLDLSKSPKPDYKPKPSDLDDDIPF